MAAIALPRHAERPVTRWLEPGRLVPLGAGLLLIYLTAVPLAMLVVGSIRVEGQAGITAANYLDAYSQARTYRLLLNSFVYAFGSATLAWASRNRLSVYAIANADAKG